MDHVVDRLTHQLGLTHMPARQTRTCTPSSSVSSSRLVCWEKMTLSVPRVNQIVPRRPRSPTKQSPHHLRVSLSSSHLCTEILHLAPPLSIPNRAPKPLCPYNPQTNSLGARSFFSSYTSPPQVSSRLPFRLCFATGDAPAPPAQAASSGGGNRRSSSSSSKLEAEADPARQEDEDEDGYTAAQLCCMLLTTFERCDCFFPLLARSPSGIFTFFAVSFSPSPRFASLPNPPPSPPSGPFPNPWPVLPFLSLLPSPFPLVFLLSGKN